MKTLCIILSLFFIATLTSCARAKTPPRLLYLQYMSEVSPDFQTKVTNAISAINAQAGYEVVALSNNGGKPLVVLNMQSSTIFAHTQYMDYECLIQIDQTNPIINNNSTDQTDLKYVFLHELGHCYGYAHTTDSSNIMYPDYPGTPYMSVAEINAAKQRITNFMAQLYQDLYK